MFNFFFFLSILNIDDDQGTIYNNLKSEREGPTLTTNIIRLKGSFNIQFVEDRGMEKGTEYRDNRWDQAIANSSQLI